MFLTEARRLGGERAESGKWAFTLLEGAAQRKAARCKVESMLKSPTRSWMLILPFVALWLRVRDAVFIRGDSRDSRASSGTAGDSRGYK